MWLLAVILCSCGNIVEHNSNVVESEIIEYDEDSIITEQAVQKESSTSEVPQDSVVYTKKRKKSIDTYLSSYSHVSVVQNFEWGSKEEAIESMGISLEYSTKTRVARLQISQHDNTVYYKDFNTGLDYEQNLYETGLKVSSKANMLTDLDVGDWHSAKDIRDDFGVVIPTGTPGVRQANKETYEYKSDVDESLLVGADYDKLGSQIIRYSFEEEDGGYSRLSYYIKITYEKEGVEYYTSCNTEISNIDNSRLSIPSASFIKR